MVVCQATVAIALIGISWAVTCWAPFAIIMEVVESTNASWFEADLFSSF